MEITDAKVKGWFYLGLIILGVILVIYLVNLFNKFKQDPSQTAADHPIGVALVTNPALSVGLNLIQDFKNWWNSPSTSSADNSATQLESGNQAP